MTEAYFDPTIDEMLLVIARRGGKTTTVFSEMIVPDLVREVQTIVLVYPTAEMGFKNFWLNTENDGFRTIEHMPQELIKNQTNTKDDMRMELWNGSVFMVLGATNAEALRGANGKKYFFDEFADQLIEAVNVVAPITEANGGKRIYMGTPKFDGINGETMRRMHFDFKADDTGTKYTNYIKATEYMTQAQLEKSRQGYILRNGNDFKFRQEMLLDWGQTSDSSYYGAILKEKYKDGSIGEYPYRKAHPVYTSWDLGKADNMAIVFWQWIDKRVRIIDSYQTNNLGLNSIIPILKNKPYNYGWHFLPWDGVVGSMNDNVSRIDYMRKRGFDNISTLRRTGVNNGIGLVTKGLPRAQINEPMNKELLRNLALYARKKNAITGDFMGPEHNSASHYADAVRYIFTAIEQNWVEGDFAYRQNEKSTSGESYEMDLVSTTFY